MTTANFYQKLDALFASHDLKAIEAFLRDAMAQNEPGETRTAAANELGCFYRGLSRFEESIEAFKKAVSSIAASFGKRSKEYATTIMNMAGTYRLSGNIVEALRIFGQAKEIYETEQIEDPYLYASILNNMALAFSDKGERAQATAYMKHSLSVLSGIPGHDIQIASTYNNLANLYRLMGSGEEAAAAIAASLAIFERDEYREDPHHAASLNTEAAILYDQGRKSDALSRLNKALALTKTTYGKNVEYALCLKSIARILRETSQSEAALSHLNEAAQIFGQIYGMEHPKTKEVIGELALALGGDSQADHASGLSIAKRYYQEIGLPMLEASFASQLDQMTVGLVGEGSECFGFDDEISRDHDWGPGFCIWLDRGDYDAFGAALKRAYQELPKRFAGYERTETPEGGGRVGVLCTDEFYTKLLGVPQTPKTIAEWLRVPETHYAAATNGELFRDPGRRFGKIRKELLAYYPEDIRLKKLVNNMIVVSQAGQYNFPRLLKREEPVASALALSEFVRRAIAVVYLLNKRYRPFYKWMHRGLLSLDRLKEAHPLFLRLYSGATPQEKVELIENICALLLKELQRQGLTTGQGDFLLDHCGEISDKIIDDTLRAAPVMEG